METPSENTQLREGQLVCWEGASNKVYGIVKRVGNELRIFTDDVHCFAIKDVINSLVIVK